MATLVRLHSFVSPEVKKAIKQEAKLQKVKESEIVRRALYKVFKVTNAK